MLDTTATQRARMYAAKICAETLRAEPPTSPDLSDDGIAKRLAGCGIRPKPHEYAAIREQFGFFRDAYT